MERQLQVTSGKSYIFNFSSFAVRVDGQVTTVPITLEQMEELENDPGVAGLIKAGEIVIHKPREVKHDSIQSASKKGNIRTNDTEDA